MGILTPPKGKGFSQLGGAKIKTNRTPPIGRLFKSLIQKSPESANSRTEVFLEASELSASDHCMIFRSRQDWRKEGEIDLSNMGRERRTWGPSWGWGGILSRGGWVRLLRREGQKQERTTKKFGASVSI